MHAPRFGFLEYALSLTFSLLISLGSLAEVSNETHLPTFFRPDLNGVQVSEPIFRYDFSSLRKPQLGPYEFSFRDFNVTFTTLVLSRSGVSNYRYAHVMSFDWPQALAREGELIVETLRGEKVFEDRVDKVNLSRWHELRQSLKEGKNPQGIQWDIEKVRTFLGDKVKKAKYGRLVMKKWVSSGFREPFRFCISKESENITSRVCSPYLEARNSGQTQLWQWKRKNPDGLSVFVNDEPAPAYAERPSRGQEKMHFQALFDNGMVLEFDRSESDVAVIEEVVADTKTGHLHVTGRGREKPAAAFWGLKGAPVSSLWELLYSDKSFGKKRHYWELELPPGSTSIVVASHSVDAFEYPIRYNLLPPKEARVYLKKQKEESYDRFPRLRGYIKEGVRLSVESPSEVDFYPEDGEFVWEMYAPKMGEFNLGKIKVNYKGRDWVSAHEIYRGHSAELRLGGHGALSGTDSFTGFLGFSGSYWFEDLLGWKNDTFSVQRWGLAVRGLQSLGGFTSSTSGAIDSAKELELGLRYRLNAGIWGRGEAIGLQLSYKTAEFDALSAKMAGVGVFWSQPMPETLDAILSFLPFFDYPKILNMDFIWFAPSSLYEIESGVNLTNNFDFNIENRIMWAPYFFGELGLGARKYEFTKGSESVDLLLGFVTFSLGLSF